MREVIDSDQMEFRFSIGVSQPSSSVKLTDREAIIQSVANHYSILSIKAELDEIVDGMKVLHMAALITVGFLSREQ